MYFLIKLFIKKFAFDFNNFKNKMNNLIKQIKQCCLQILLWLPKKAVHWRKCDFNMLPTSIFCYFGITNQFFFSEMR